MLDLNRLVAALVLGKVYIDQDILDALPAIEEAFKTLATACEAYGQYPDVRIEFYFDEDIDPRPVETPPSFAKFSDDQLQPKFDIGQPIKIREDVDGEASPYAGRSGRIVRIARMPSGIPYYETDLTTVPLSAGELELAD